MDPDRGGVLGLPAQVRLGARRYRRRSKPAATGAPGRSGAASSAATSDGRSGLPSEKVRPFRRWNVTRFAPSSNRHDSARAGRTSRFASKAVSDSNSWAVIAALPASPCAAGSSVVGAPVRMRTVRSAAAPGVAPIDTDQQREQGNEDDGPAHRAEYTGGGRRPRRRHRRQRSVAARAWNEASQIRTAGGTMEPDLRGL